MTLLEVTDLSMRFGGILALEDVSFSVKKDSITALIGPNGAGKTTVFNCVTGFYKASKGAIHFDGNHGSVNLVKILGEHFQPTDFINPVKLVNRLYYKLFGGSHLVTRAGVGRTFQNVRLFKDMSVIENLLVAQHARVNRNLISGVFETNAFKRAEEAAIDQAIHWLEVFGLTEDGNRLAGELPYGHQRRLEIARAMCVQPRLLCLDEPAAGLNPQETRDLSALIRMLRDKYHITVLLIEHDMGLVMDISDAVVVLDYGRVIAKGNPKSVQEDPQVLAAYLGVDAEEAA
ncbi:MAG: ATP-binding cassette domain-containing protein [Magnetococcales bacterium]|nr:ATP-binding cassette domain-containing protein [Magnetococcales bacterium]